MGWNELSDPDMRTANFEFSCDVYRDRVYMVAKCTPVEKLVFSLWSETSFSCVVDRRPVWLSPTNHSPEQCFTYSSQVIIDLSNKALIFLLMSVRELLKHRTVLKEMKGCLQRHVWPYTVWESSATSLIIPVITVQSPNSAYRGYSNYFHTACNSEKLHS